MENTQADDGDFQTARTKHDQYRSKLYNDFLREMSSKCKDNPKEFWKYINNKRKSNTLPETMEYGGKFATSNVDKANLFGKFFSSVYQNYDTDDDITSLIDNRNDYGFQRIVITPEIVESVLLRMNLSKGSGHDRVSSLFLRECADIICEPLCMIYSNSMKYGFYPKSFQIGQVTPIYKSGKRTLIRNYRGVNVLPNLAKVFEIIVYNQLKLIIHPRLSESQHGFVSNRNIETNLLELTVRAHDAFEQKAQLDVIYIDIAKAFDSVDRNKLMRKMMNFPLANELLFWFSSYLSMGKQYVQIGNSKSDMFPVTSGVGQGTILGPLLFTIFFNDSDPGTDHVFSINFADNKKIGLIIKSLSDAQKLQDAINEFVSWCDSNRLDINLSKCKIITYNSKNKKNRVHFDYCIRGHKIDRVTEIKDLGIMMDENLQFNKHLEYITNKAKNALYFVQRQSYKLDHDVVRILYTSLVSSNLEFA